MAQEIVQVEVHPNRLERKTLTTIGRMYRMREQDIRPRCIEVMLAKWFKISFSNLSEMNDVFSRLHDANKIVINEEGRINLQSA